MRKREWMEYAAAVLLTGALLSGCGNIRKLSKSDPEAEVHLPARTKRERAYRARTRSVRRGSSPSASRTGPNSS